MKFTVAQVPGSKRVSDRNYTHAVIGQTDYDKIIALQKNERTDMSNFDFYEKCAKAQPGDQYNSDGCHFTIDAKMIEQGKQQIARALTRTAYADLLRRTRIEAYQAAKEKQGDKLFVLQWSQSAVNAEKGARSYSNKCYKNVQVVTTQQINH